MTIFLWLIFLVINLYSAAEEKNEFKGLHCRSLPDITEIQQHEKDSLSELPKESDHLRLSLTDRGMQMFELGAAFARKGDRESAMKWFLEAAQYNEQRAMNVLGMDCRREGHRKTAKHWFSRGAELGNVIAKYNLACLYHEEENIEDAIMLYQEVQGSYPTAKNNLAVILYEQGHKEQALQLWKEAKAQNCLSAIFNIAWFDENLGNVESAKEGYKQSADKGDSEGMFYLARLYEKEGDVLNAKSWYRKAAEKGNEEAKAKLKEMGSGSGGLKRRCKRKLSLL
jgi:TPR repeat protein